MTFYDTITNILRTVEKYPDGENNILPTALFNEGWMLRMVLDWFSHHRETGFPISFDKEARWISEGRLETIFKGGKGAPGEKHTRADGAYGNITVGRRNTTGKGISDIRIADNCRQFVTIEAKMNSPYSTEVTNSGLYPQPVRYAACMSYIAYKQKADIGSIKDMAFYTFLPESKRDDPAFKKYTAKDFIKNAVSERMQKFADHAGYSEKEKWYKGAFLPFLDKLCVKCISWEELLAHIKKNDNESFMALNDFYDNCKRYNGIEQSC